LTFEAVETHRRESNAIDAPLVREVYVFGDLGTLPSTHDMAKSVYVGWKPGTPLFEELKAAILKAEEMAV